MASRSFTWIAASMLATWQSGCWLTQPFDHLTSGAPGDEASTTAGGGGSGEGGASSVTTATAATATGGSNLDCEGPTADCDEAAENGCEARLDNDPENCGACGHDCLVGECVAHQCKPEVLAAGECAPKGVALLGKRLLWADYSGCPEGDGCNNAAGGCIRMLDLDSGGPAVNLVEGLQKPTGLAVHLDTIKVFWTELNPALGGEINATLVDDPDEIEAVAHGVGIYPEGLAIGGDRGAEFIYWADTDRDAIFRVPFGALGTDGALVQPFASTIGTRASPIGIVADADGVFWAEYASGRLARAEPGDPENAATWLDGLGRPWYVTFDSEHVYWTDREHGTVSRRRRSGEGEVEVIASKQALPAGIAVDEFFVYWSNRGDAEILRVAK